MGGGGHRVGVAAVGKVGFAALGPPPWGVWGRRPGAAAFWGGGAAALACGIRICGAQFASLGLMDCVCVGGGG